MSRIIRPIIVLTAIASVLLASGCNLFLPPAAVPTVQPTDQVISEPLLPTTQPTLAPTPTAVVLSTLEPGKVYRGTVRPPGCNGVTVVATGSYSICGVAVANVTMKRDGVLVTVVPQDTTPQGGGKVLVGAISLSVLVDNLLMAGPHYPYASIQMCYAAPAGLSLEIRFFDPQANLWTALPTTVAGGQACAIADFSGIYILALK